MAGFDDDINYGNSGGKQAPSMDDVRRQSEALEKKNQQDLINSLYLEPDKRDGKTRLFGVEVPKTLVPIINVAVDTLVGPISNSVADSVFKQSSRLGEYYLKDATKAHHLATNAELATRWGIIFAKPISQFVTANMGLAQERKALYKKLKPVMEATGVNYYKNEVVKSAFQQLHDDWFERLTLIAPDALSLVPQVLYGLEKQKQVRELRSGQLDGIEALNKSVQDVVSEQTKKIRSGIDLQMQTEKIYAEQRKAFINKPPKEMQFDEKGERLTTKELGQYFDNHIGRPLRKRIEEQQRNAEKSQATNKIDEKATEEKLTNRLLFWTPLMSTASQATKAAMHESHEKRNRVTTLQLIEHLHEELNNQIERKSPPSADEIMITPLDDSRKSHSQGRSLLLRDFVVSIFQELEDDMSRTKFAGGLQERLEKAIEPIVENIASGRLDAMALVKLVGEDKVVVHGAGGKRSFRTEKEIRAAVDELLGGRLDQADGISSEEFFANFANACLAKETVAKNLKTMAAPERGFFASIMPNEVLMQAGFKMPAIVQMRKEGHKALYDVVAESVLELAPKSEEALVKLGLSKEAAAEIKRMEQQIIAGEDEALRIAVDGKDHTLINAIGVATLNEQMAGNKNSWADRVVKAATVRERINQIREEMQQSQGALPMDEEKVGLRSKAEHELARREQMESRENHLGQGA